MLGQLYAEVSVLIREYGVGGRSFGYRNVFADHFTYAYLYRLVQPPPIYRRTGSVLSHIYPTPPQSRL